jgi:hypothetical protein
MSPNAASSSQMVKVFFPAESQMALHVAETPGPLDLPVDLLDVIIHFRRQHATTFGATGFEHAAAIPGAHTAAKTVHANPASSFGLVCALWHSETSFKKRAQGALSSSTTQRHSLTAASLLLWSCRVPQAAERQV